MLGRRFFITVLLACGVFGCGERDEGPCGGCSTSVTTNSGGEAPGVLTARASGEIVFDGDRADLSSSSNAFGRIDAPPFSLLVSREGILVYSDRPCTMCGPPAVEHEQDAGPDADATIDAGADADAAPPPMHWGEYLALKIVFKKDAFDRRGIQDVGIVGAQTCREGTLSARFDDASCFTASGRTVADSVRLRGTLTIVELSPLRFSIDATIEHYGSLNIEYVETRGPSSFVPAQVECRGSYG